MHTRSRHEFNGANSYRGLGGTLELPDSFTNADEYGCKGYCEFGFMSTTADRNVAVQYSGVKDKKPRASIMEIQPNAIDRGADISEFSQYATRFLQSVFVTFCVGILERKSSCSCRCLTCKGKSDAGWKSVPVAACSK
jgi:hypothetical protein